MESGCRGEFGHAGIGDRLAAIMSQSPIATTFKTLVQEAITPVLKPAGFKKTGLNYHRRHGATVQVINLQQSAWNQWNRKEFFINVGIAFDQIHGLVGTPIALKPKEYECDEVGTRGRLEEFIKEAPALWTVDGNSNLSLITERLRSCVSKVTAELDQINNVQTYSTHRWFERHRPATIDAKIFYVMGDDAAAWQEVQHLVEVFHDRGNNTIEWWIERLNLSRLRALNAIGTLPVAIDDTSSG
jgi:Domain of unknown function (DUF4304)